MKTSEIGEHAMELMEALEREHPDAEVGVVALIAEINTEEYTVIRYRCSDDRRWVQEGLFRAAERAVGRSEAPDDEA